MPNALRVDGLFVHPLKACGGLSLQRMELDALGPVPDRRFLVVDEAGRFVTQRELPALAAIRCSLVAGPPGDGAEAAPVLRIEAPDLMPQRIPVAGHPGPRREVLCWADRCEAIDQGDALAHWLTRHAGRSLRLVRLAADWRRPVDPRHAPRPAATSFSDGFPLLLLSRASLRDLNRRLEGQHAPLAMDRFRPNLVVEGCEAYAEDEWRELRIVAPDGSVRAELDVVKPCSRCVVTTTDQQSLERGSEPLKTLARYRRSSLGGGAPAVYFGQNAVHHGAGAIEMGDRVEVVQRGPSPFAASQSSR